MGYNLETLGFIISENKPLDSARVGRYNHPEQRKGSGVLSTSFFFLLILKFYLNLFTYLFLIGGKLPYSVVLVSAIYQHESAVRLYMSSPSWTSLPPRTTLLGYHRVPDLSFLPHTENYHWLSNFIYGNIYVSMVLSQFVPFSPSHSESKSLCLYLHCYPANRFISTIFLDSIYMH